MLIVFILLLLMLGNWLVSAVLVFLPLQIVDYLTSSVHFFFCLLALLILGWFFGD